MQWCKVCLVQLAFLLLLMHDFARKDISPGTRKAEGRCSFPSTDVCPYPSKSWSKTPTHLLPAPVFPQRERNRNQLPPNADFKVSAESAEAASCPTTSSSLSGKWQLVSAQSIFRELVMIWDKLREHQRWTQWEWHHDKFLHPLRKGKFLTRLFRRLRSPCKYWFALRKTLSDMAKATFNSQGW